MDTIKEVSRLHTEGEWADHGHLQDLRTDPVGLLQRVRDECGDVGRFRLADRDVVLVTGAEPNEVFFRAPDEVLDQAEAYPFMTPIFGKGVVFDTTPEKRREALKNQALRGEMMRGHAATIEAEVHRMVAGWGDAGEIDLLDFFAELTIYTTSACLIGQRFREELDGRFAAAYHDLEKGTDAVAYVDAHADIESFHRRDAARVELVGMVEEIIGRRRTEGPPPKEERDLLDVLISLETFSADEITGMFISMMFAGHHTSSGTAAWTLIELLRHPSLMSEVRAELDALYADGSAVSFQALREIPLLEAALKETLRLHPPLILLLRVAQEDIELGGHLVPKGTMVGASPKVSNRIAEDFPDPDAFDPGRYLDPRQEDLTNRWTWIPFGAGRHRCVGNAFAMMQLKAIFSVLLRDYDFTLAQPDEDYRDDCSKMVIQLAQPCRVRYRRRHSDSSAQGEPGKPRQTADESARSWRVTADRDLCQAHQMCQAEAPEVFGFDADVDKVALLDEHPPDDQRPKVDNAVRYCPAMALTVSDDVED